MLSDSMQSKLDWFRVPNNALEMMSDPAGFRIIKRQDASGHKFYTLHRETDANIKPVAVNIDYQALMELADKLPRDEQHENGDGV